MSQPVLACQKVSGSNKDRLLFLFLFFCNCNVAHTNWMSNSRGPRAILLLDGWVDQSPEPRRRMRPWAWAMLCPIASQDPICSTLPALHSQPRPARFNLTRPFAPLCFRWAFVICFTIMSRSRNRQPRRMHLPREIALYKRRSAPLLIILQT